MVDLNAISSYEPRWPAVKELNLADQWRARWNDEPELPDGAPVQHIYALLFLADKGYAVREPGANKWGMIEGSPGDLTASEFLKASAKSIGATIGNTELIGYFECRPTRHNTEFKAGDTVVRPLYVISAKAVKDVPEGSPWERRRFPQNEYMVAMRAHYPQLLEQLTKAMGRYAVLQAQSR